MPVERPPILQGSAQQQLAALRDYLFRLAGSLETIQSAPATYTTTGGTASGGGGGTEASMIERIRQNARELKALIVKTAHDITADMDEREEEYHGEFVAQSEYGSFQETLDARIETNARNVIERYGYSSAIQAVQESVGTIQDYYTQISGEIRRGFLEDPDHPGELVFGIAISSRLRFTGSKQTRDGYEYYELEGRQTFGLYTATGWQFWIEGHKAGWFDSLDGMLHAANIYVEDNLRFGDTWRIRQTDDNELEIMYVGV